MCHQTFNPNFLTKKLRNIVLFYELIDKFPKFEPTNIITNCL